MTMKSDEAKRAIEKMFSDTSVSIDETLGLLTDLRAEIDEKINTLKEDIGDD